MSAGVGPGPAPRAAPAAAARPPGVRVHEKVAGGATFKTAPPAEAASTPPPPRPPPPLPSGSRPLMRPIGGRRRRSAAARGTAEAAPRARQRRGARWPLCDAVRAGAAAENTREASVGRAPDAAACEPATRTGPSHGDGRRRRASRARGRRGAVSLLGTLPRRRRRRFSARRPVAQRRGGRARDAGCRARSEFGGGGSCGQCEGYEGSGGGTARAGGTPRHHHPRSSTG